MALDALGNEGEGGLSLHEHVVAAVGDHETGASGYLQSSASA
jgi:hypothetical protein